MAALQTTCLFFETLQSRSSCPSRRLAFPPQQQAGLLARPIRNRWKHNQNRHYGCLIRAENAPEDDRFAENDQIESEGTADDELSTSVGAGNANQAMDSTVMPTQTTNRSIAVASAMGAVLLFLTTRGGFSGATLGDLAASSIPYEEALANGRPTVLEFYADWCEVCREMAPDVYKVEQQYRDNVNFVMLNVDNSKWEEELDEFGVEGIPHFAFLDRKGNEEGNIVGRLPKRYLEENVIALSKGEPKIPHTRVIGQFSNADSRQSPKVTDPRSHG